MSPPVFALEVWLRIRCALLALMLSIACTGAIANELDNPGFEGGNISPWQAWGGFNLSSGNARSGSFSVAVDSGSGGGATLAATPGAAYAFSGWGRTSGTSGSAVLFIKFFDSSWNELGQLDGPDSFASGWLQRSVTATAPASAAWVQVAVWNQSGNTLYLDDVSLTLVDGNGGGSTGGGNTGDTNLLQNRGFESGNVTGWQAWGNFYAVDNNSRSGGWAATSPAYNGGGVNLPATGGTTYTWSAWGKRTGSGWAGLQLRFFDSTWNLIGAAQQSDSFGASYGQQTITSTAPANAANIQVALWNGSTGDAYIDDISLTGGGNSGGGGSNGGGGNSASNLIPDGGFENGNTSQWQSWGTFNAATGGARSGNYAVLVPNNNGGGIFIDVTGSSNYVFSGWGKTGGGGWAGLLVKFFDASWSEVNTQLLSQSFSSSWSEQNISMTIPASAVRVQLSVWNSSGASLMLDDTSLVPGGDGSDSSGSGNTGGGNSGGGNSGGGNSGGGTGGSSGVQSSDPQITGSRYFVSPSGSGVSGNRNSPGNVNATIRKICDNSSSQIKGGDAVIFLDGQYLTSTFSLGFSADSNQPGHGGHAIAMVNRNCGGPAYVHLLAENQHRAVIRNNANWHNHSGGFDIRNSSYIWVEGFRIEGAFEYAVGFESGVSVGYGSHHAVVRKNQISYVGGGGIVANRGTHLRIENNEVTGAAGYHPYCASGISIFEPDNPAGYADDANGYSNYILGNKVYGTRTRAGCDSDANSSNGVASYDGNCIVLDQFAHHGYRKRTLIEGNLCVDNGGGGVHMYNSGDTDVLNNTIFASGQVSTEGGLSVSCVGSTVTSQNVRFASNLVHTFSGTALTATDYGLGCLRNVEHRHNIFVNKNPQASNIRGTTVALTSDASRLSDCSSSWNLQSVSTSQAGWANPRTNGSSSDFQLTAGAVGLNRGSCSVTPNSGVDFQGGSRISGGQVDVGAFEY